ncbi:hypothetical protein BN1303_00657 [Mycobacterium tuberculosis]|nr:hypothetical protein BN1303_00657 [Mycobacterium tuberculosis]
MFDGEFDRLGVVRHLDGIIGRDDLAERGGRPPFRQAGQVDGRLGGSTETDVNELAAMPTGWSSTIAQTAITPHGKQPKTRRSPTSSR